MNIPSSARAVTCPGISEVLIIAGHNVNRQGNGFLDTIDVSRHEYNLLTSRITRRIPFDA